MNTDFSAIPTRHWSRLADGRMQCDVCPRRSRLHEGQRGLCIVRGRGRDGIELYTYGRSSGFCVDRIEKKPLNYRNDGAGRTFTLVPDSVVTQDVGRDSWVPAWGGYDNDGFLDLFVARSSGYGPLLYHNNGNTNNWLMVKLRGTTSNPQGVGAKVRVRAVVGGQTRWQRREVTGGDVYNGNRLVAHFGLGSSRTVQTLRIEWP